jgi:hypothetical protein
MRIAKKMATLTACIVAAAIASGAQASVTVSTVDQLIAAIGPNKLITLKAGTYVLSRSTSKTSKYVSWEDHDGDGGLTLTVSGVEGLSLRGDGKVRFLLDNASMGALAFAECKNASVSGIEFVRNVSKDDDGFAGFALKAKGCYRLAIADCAAIGPSNVGFSFDSCSDVSMERVRIEGVTMTALQLYLVEGLSFEGGTIRDCAGIPLIYAWDAEDVRFSGTEFVANTGYGFVSIGSYELSSAVSFMDCSFIEQSFDWFSETAEVPSVEGCEFVDSSFDEYWEESSVNYEGYEYGSATAGLSGTYAWDVAGVQFDYPPGWEMIEAEGMAVFGSPDGEVGVVCVYLGDWPKGVDPAKSSSKAMAEGFKLLSPLISELGEGKFKQSSASNVMDLGGGVYAVRYQGSVAGGYVDMMLIAYDGSYYAIIGVTEEPELAGEGSELDALLSSVFSTR